MKFKAFCAALTVLVSASLASADLAIYDPFLVGSPAVAANGEYNTGNIASQNPTIDGFTNAWRFVLATPTVIGTGLSYGAQPVDGGALSLGFNTRAIRTLSAPVTAASTGTLYLSLLIQSTGASGDAYHAFELNNGSDGDATRALQFGLNTTDLLSVSQFGLRLNQNNSLRYSTSVANNQEVNLVVFRFDLSDANNGDRLQVFLNPNLAAGEPGTAQLDITNINTAFDRVQFARFLGSSGETLRFDEFRMGDTWDAVVIPEPSSWMLVACGLLGLLALRRRR